MKGRGLKFWEKKAAAAASDKQAYQNGNFAEKKISRILGIIITWSFYENDFVLLRTGLFSGSVKTGLNYVKGDHYYETFRPLSTWHHVQSRDPLTPKPSVPADYLEATASLILPIIAHTPYIGHVKVE